MKFDIGVIFEKLCSKFEFLEYLHRKILLRGVNEFMSNCGRRSARNAVQVSAFRQTVRRDGRTFVMGVGASTCTRVPRDVRRSDSHSARHIADGAVRNCRLPQSIQTVSGALPPFHTVGSRGSSRV